MIKEQFLEPFAIRRVCVKGRRITFHQLFARGIAGNAQESVVEVQKVSLRSRDEHAFLNVRNKCAVFFFGNNSNTERPTHDLFSRPVRWSMRWLMRSIRPSLS